MWDRETILSELRKLSRRGEPMWSRRIRETHSSLYAAAIHWMGSYRKAVEAAGIDYTGVRRMTPGRWNRKTIAAELRKLHRQREPIHHAAMDRNRPELVVAAYRYFDSYQAAIEAAGFRYEDIRVRPMPSWDKKRVVQELKDLHKQDQGLWKRAIRRSNPYLERAAAKHFGSYARAAKASGIPAKLLEPPPFRFWSPDRITDDLRTLYRKDRSLLKPTTLDDKNPNLLRACRRRFGTYEKAIASAGLPYDKIARVTLPALSKPEVVEMLTARFEKGGDLRYAAMARDNSRLLEAARARFGTYRKAVQASGIEYPPPPPLRHWTAKNVLTALRELHAKGKDLRFRPFKKHNVPLFEAARYYYGTFVRAVEKAGIDYAEVVRRQLAKQLPNRHLAFSNGNGTKRARKVAG